MMKPFLWKQLFRNLEQITLKKKQVTGWNGQCQTYRSLIFSFLTVICVSKHLRTQASDCTAKSKKTDFRLGITFPIFF